LIHLSHPFTSASKPAAQKTFDCCLSCCRIFTSTSSSSMKRPSPRWFFSESNRQKSLGASLGYKVDVQEVPTVVLEFSPRLLGLYRVWHCHH
jgi:hypothetical protein